MLHILLFFFFIQPILSASNQIYQKMIITVPVANLRYEPSENNNITLPASDLDNPLQASQLLLGEYIIAHEQYTDEQSITWLKVDAIQQQAPVQLYPGWIRADQAIIVENFPKYNLVVKNYVANIYDQNNSKIFTLSIGTQLQGIQKNNLWEIFLPDGRKGFINNDDVYDINPIIKESTQELTKSIISTAHLFLGNWYSWGGRSAQNENEFGICSVDCSSLLQLSFLAHGLLIPRMSHEQFLQSEKIEFGKDLLPGDFIFFSSLVRYKYPMDHVMLYLGDDMILETTFIDDSKARIISFEKRLGKPINSISYGDSIEFDNDIFEIYFGSFLRDVTLLQKLRNKALET